MMLGIIGRAGPPGTSHDGAGPSHSAAAAGASSSSAMMMAARPSASTSAAGAAGQGSSSRGARQEASGASLDSGSGSGGPAQVQGQHGREASGRSIRSVLSRISPAAVLRDSRERDRDETLATIERRHAAAQDAHDADDLARLEAARGAPGAPVPAGGAPDAAAAATYPPPPPAVAAPAPAALQPADLALQSAMLGPAGRSAERRKQASKRERDEAATLFGPTLSNYFGSGSSSSGAVNGGGFASAAAAAAAAAAAGAANGTPNPADPAAFDPAAQTPARGVRLGSRGRARGASLSGLSTSALGASVSAGAGANAGGSAAFAPPTPSGETPGGEAPPALTPGAGAGLADLETPWNAAPPPAREDSMSMADGIDLSTLARWVDRTVGLIPPAGQQDGLEAKDAAKSAAASSYAGAPGSMPAPLHTLSFGASSYAETPLPQAQAQGAGGVGGSASGSASASAQPLATPGGTSIAVPPAPVICTTLQSYVNLKRNTVRLALLDRPAAAAARPSSPNAPAGAASSPASPRAPAAPGSTPVVGDGPLGAGSASTSAGAAALPPPTHALQFEYDCAAPYASVHIFLRASRKHGSWGANAAPQLPAAGNGNANGEEAEAKYLAEKGVPPQHVLGYLVHSATLKKGFAARAKADLALKLSLFAPPGKGKKDGAAAAPAAAAAAAAATAPSPALPAQDLADLTLNPVATNATADAGPVHPEMPAPNAAAAAAPQQQQPAATATPSAPLTKEERAERAAREKAERETLKMAIVVEALDEDSKPLREPNLQTTYLRVSSLPARLPDGTADPVNRAWSLQVEGQEAEIGPHRFQLQELYGLSSKPPPVSAQHHHDAADAEHEGGAAGDTGVAEDMPLIAQDDSGGSECLICLSEPPSTLLLPCTHGLCLQCAIQLRESVKGVRDSERRRGKNPKRKYACPVCRRVYTSMLHISTADEKQVAHQA